jgi:beta-glucosidase
MAQAAFHFPRGFLWGAATASHQVEGNNTNNNWWAWEQQPGRILQGHKSGLACDWWAGRWREDFDRAAQDGHNAHRLSIEWSRIQPAPDRWDENALDRYLNMLRGLSERRLTPLVTLHHFSDPLWLTEMGGWENDKAPQYFAAYVERVVEALKDYVTLWVTINEPNIYASLGYFLGLFPPGKSDLGAALEVAVNLLKGHAAAYHAIHQLQPQARVGLAVNYRSFVPARSWGPLSGMMAHLRARIFNDAFPKTCQTGVLRVPTRKVSLPEVKGTQDFLGLNYYTRDVVSFNPFNPGGLFADTRFDPQAEQSPSRFMANEPQGLFEALKWCRQFELPVIITENGVEDAEDVLRPRYLVQHLHQVWRAVNFNFPVKGYFHWTLVDNFEWERGWTQRFGLWELDVETQARRKRKSADLYAEICRENGITSEIVARYTPELFEEMFPN